MATYYYNHVCQNIYEACQNIYLNKTFEYPHTTITRYVKIYMRVDVTYDHLWKIMNNHIILSHRKLDIRAIKNIR